MKVLYIEVLATHDGPEPCVGRSRGRRRSVGRGRAGWVIEPRNTGSGVPTLCREAEGNISGGDIASRRGTPRGRRTLARTKFSMFENREILRSLVLVDDAPSGTVRGVVGRRVAGREGNAEAVSPR
jgi:hypothetical protein